MIDDVYKTLLTIINKEQNGYVKPEDFNSLAHLVQSEIFREYFEDENRDKIRENKGLTNNGYSNLPHNQRERITRFSSKATISKTGNDYTLPDDLYFIEDQGIIDSTGNVVEEIEKHLIGYASRSIAAPTELYPVYERYENTIEILPIGVVNDIVVRYVRIPKYPRWTYRIVSGSILFDSSSNSYQDFELHPSEFSNIVLKMLTHFGINIREAEVVQIAEQLKHNLNVKDNG